MNERMYYKINRKFTYVYMFVSDIEIQQKNPHLASLYDLFICFLIFECSDVVRIGEKD